MSNSQDPIPPQPDPANPSSPLPGDTPVGGVGPDPNLPPPPPPGAGRDAVPPLPYETVGGVDGIEPNHEARTFGMLCHLLSLTVWISGLGMFVGPLVVWLIKKDQYPFVDDQGKESINFQITTLIAALIGAATSCIGIGVIILILVGIGHLILTIVATVAAYSGTRYRYPFCLRLIK